MNYFNTEIYVDFFELEFWLHQFVLERERERLGADCAVQCACIFVYINVHTLADHSVWVKLTSDIYYQVTLHIAQVTIFVHDKTW